MTTPQRNACNTLKQILSEIPTIHLGVGNEEWIKKKNSSSKAVPIGVKFKHTKGENIFRKEESRVMAEEKAWMYG